jgi:tRNA-uridine 2-sulfurtransferase
MKKDIKNNRLIVGYGKDEELFSDTLYIDELHLLSGQVQDLPLQRSCTAKIRYRQVDQMCEIRDRSDETGLPGRYEIKFEIPQRAIAAGQIVAFYDGDELWGSGVII